MQKTAVVTGARRGIGLKVAQKLKEEGYNVVRAALSEDSAEDYFQCDISLEKDRRAAGLCHAKIRKSRSSRKQRGNCA